MAVRECTVRVEGGTVQNDLVLQMQAFPEAGSDIVLQAHTSRPVMHKQRLQVGGTFNQGPMYLHIGTQQSEAPDPIFSPLASQVCGQVVGPLFCTIGELSLLLYTSWPIKRKQPRTLSVQSNACVSLVLNLVPELNEFNASLTS